MIPSGCWRRWVILMKAAPGFFDVDERLRRLSDLGDQLEAYGRVVDFEAFRSDLEKALAYTSGPRGGRPPYDRKRCRAHTLAG